MTMSKRLGETLPYKEFVRRSGILNMYREMNRAARRIEDPILRVSLSNEIRDQFRHNADLKDAMSLKGVMLESGRQLEVSIRGYISIPLVSHSMQSCALDSSDLLLSYPITSPT